MIHPHKKSPTLVRILKMSRDVVGSAEYIVPSLEKQVKGVSTPHPSDTELLAEKNIWTYSR